jgi:hypothetical protein
MVRCGEIRAFNILSEYLKTTHSEIKRMILTLYMDYYKDTATALNMFIEQAKLLWMRQYKGEDDVLRWFKLID